MGAINELSGRGCLSCGTILESQNFTGVYIDGFNGVRYLSQSSIIVVDALEYRGSQTVVVKDAAADPTRDRSGRRVFGEVGRCTELFRVVGHIAMGGQQIWFDEHE